MSYILHDRPQRFCAVGDSRSQNSFGYGQWADITCRGYGWKRVGVYNAAIAGTLTTNIDATADNLYDNLEVRAINHHADVYAILEGTNDLLHTSAGNTLLTIKTWGDQLGDIIESLARLPWRPTVYVLGITPLYAGALAFANPFGSSWQDCWVRLDNESYRQCLLHGAIFVPLVTFGVAGSLIYAAGAMPASDFVGDGIHPNPAGMAYIAGVFETFTQELIYR